jgi:HrpA-like RNA helicase
VATQPRRIAASSVAMRIAAERGENLGRSVGYTIRLESKAPRNYGSIELVTSGVLLQRLQSDPALMKISHLILDEVHERDSICDILMSIIKKVINLI